MDHSADDSVPSPSVDDEFTIDSAAHIVRNQSGVREASLQGIFWLLVSQPNFDHSMAQTFFLTYRSFTTPVIVLREILERYNYSSSTRTQLNCVNLLHTWHHRFWIDFSSDPYVIEQCLKFFHRRSQDAPESMRNVFRAMEESLRTSLSGLGTPKPKNVFQLIPSLLKDSENQRKPMLKYPAEEIARQFTLMQWELWSKLEPKEFLSMGWVSVNRTERSPNIISLINFHNFLSSFVCTAVILEDSPRHRVKRIEQFIDICNHCRSWNDFGTIFAVFSGLENASIHRLSESYKDVSPSHQTTMGQLKDLSVGSYYSLRLAIRQAQPPVLPYLGIYLTDLVFIEDGNVDTVGPLMNWHKRTLTAMIMQDIMSMQRVPYHFTPLPWLQNRLISMPSLLENDLWEISQYIQPRKGATASPMVPEALTKAKRVFSSELSPASAASLEPTASSSSPASSSTSR